MTDEKDFVRFMEERFGITKKAYAGFTLHETGDKIYALSSDISHKDLTELKIVQIGIVVGRMFKNEDKFKPTTIGLQIFGKFATKNTIELTEKEKWDCLRGLDIEKKAEVENGFVLLTCNGDSLGCGLFMNGVIKNQIPKPKRLAMR